MHTSLSTPQVLSTFLEFFRDRGHQRVTGSTLLPPPDDPVLFTTSGMHPLTPYLQGRPHPLGRRLVDVQRCLRTTDLDEVGDPSHLTVFEMLGTWSIGDYEHPQSLRWGLELLRDGLDIPPNLLHVTVFGGDEQTGVDQPALDTWGELGLPVELLGDDNWWSNGPTGLCGPDSEMFVWTGDGPPVGTPSSDERWVEVWNHVNMRYLRRDDGTLSPLKRPNVDTGMGLERLLAVLQGRSSVFETDLFEPWTRPVSQLWPLDLQPRRVVIDHLRSSVVVVGDGVRPSSSGRGYVLRRLLRRSLTALWRVDPSYSLEDLPVEPIGHTLAHFGQETNLEDVRRVLLDEQRRFRDLVRRGRPVVERQRSRGPLTDDDYRYLHDTHGLPRELVEELERGF
jgi:alanyl-tRNA synthetase